LKNKRRRCFAAGKDCRRRTIANIAENGINVIEGLTKGQNKEAEQSNTEPKVDGGKITKKNNFLLDTLIFSMKIKKIITKQIY
jgi:hypothetical protein